MAFANFNYSLNHTLVVFLYFFLLEDSNGACEMGSGSESVMSVDAALH
jgi:hypothetical protein